MVEKRTIASLINQGAERWPDRPALIDDETTYSYGEVRHRALKIAGGLEALGVGWQDAVLLMLDNSLDYCLAFLATNLSGIVEVPVNTAYKGQILAHVINNSGAKVMVLEEAYLGRIATIASELKHLETLVIRRRAGIDRANVGELKLRAVAFAELTGHAPASVVTVEPWDLLGILYTSGTTGQSKGVRVTQAHSWDCYRPSHWDAAGHQEVVLVTQPLFHLGGQWAGVSYAMHSGGTAVIQPGFSASRFWEQVRKFGCTQTLMLGAVANFLYRQEPRPDDRDHSLARVIMIPVIPEVADFKARFGVEVATAYGLTEGSSPIVSRYGEAVPGFCGRPRAEYEVRIVDEHDQDVPVGATGEAVIRPQQPWFTMDGYHDMPSATVAAWRNLWLHTGDAMSCDANGLYRFVDRRKDAIRRRGENVSSFEVEAEINRHPAVLESAVVAVPSEHTEDEIMAVIVLKPNETVDPADLTRFLIDRLPYFMVPRYLQFVAELAKTPTQKIQKEALRASGVNESTWDRERAGIRVTRDS
jgi:crotonobetaine/carnitine-CoA ligase